MTKYREFAGIEYPMKEFLRNEEVRDDIFERARLQALVARLA